MEDLNVQKQVTSPTKKDSPLSDSGRVLYQKIGAYLDCFRGAGPVDSRNTKDVLIWISWPLVSPPSMVR
jgi:hypothetical protein